MLSPASWKQCPFNCQSSALYQSQTAYSIRMVCYKAGSPRTRSHLYFNYSIRPLDIFGCHRKENIIPDDMNSQNNNYRKELPQFILPKTVRDKLTHLLSDVLGIHIQVVVNGDKTCPDGIVEFLQRLTCCNSAQGGQKWKRRRSSTHPTQVGLSSAHCWAQSKVFLYIVSHVPHL